jgi:L-ascorbate metabolism protein UlaG (beta-lactamase superfamily)
MEFTELFTRARAGRARLGSLSLRTREREDRDVARSLAWEDDPPGLLPVGTELEWLGTAGFRITFEGVTLLIDPYVSRADLARVATGGVLRSDPRAVERHLPPADAVLVGHTHFDHAVDVPAVVARDDATAYGSASVQRLLGLFGQERRAVVVEPHRRYEIGPFTVTFVPSRHSKLLGGLAVPFGGEFTCHHLDGLHAAAYRCGQVWGIRIEFGGCVVYHQGSADLIDDEIPHEPVDVFLCGIAGRMFTEDYVARIMRRLQPSVVVPQHWDDFFRPLDAPVGSSFNVNLHRFPDEVARATAGPELRTLQPMRPVRG